MAGVVGIDPRGLTLRQLFWMHEGKRRELWDHTSLLAAKIHNAFCTKKSQLRGVVDFHPYLQKRKDEQVHVAANTGEVLQAAFCGK